MSGSRVWMVVSSCGAVDENAITVRFVEKIGKIVVETGSGQLFMTPDIAEQLFARLRELGVTIPEQHFAQESDRWSGRDWFPNFGGAVDVLAQPRVTLAGEPDVAVVRR